MRLVISFIYNCANTFSFRNGSMMSKFGRQKNKSHPVATAGFITNKLLV